MFAIFDMDLTPKQARQYPSMYRYWVDQGLFGARSFFQYTAAAITVGVVSYYAGTLTLADAVINSNGRTVGHLANGLVVYWLVLICVSARLLGLSRRLTSPVLGWIVLSLLLFLAWSGIYSMIGNPSFLGSDFHYTFQRLIDGPMFFFLLLLFAVGTCALEVAQISLRLEFFPSPIDLITAACRRESTQLSENP